MANTVAAVHTRHQAAGPLCEPMAGAFGIVDRALRIRQTAS